VESQNTQFIEDNMAQITIITTMVLIIIVDHQSKTLIRSHRNRSISVLKRNTKCTKRTTIKIQVKNIKSFIDLVEEEEVKTYNRIKVTGEV
jgi:signal transduction histidine kinase